MTTFTQVFHSTDLKLSSNSVAKVLRDRLRIDCFGLLRDSSSDVDASESWPDGRDREEDEALPLPSDGRGVGADFALLPKLPRRGRKAAVDLREVLNAIRYMARSGGGWRMLPHDFPPWQTVYFGGSAASCGCFCSAPSMMLR